MYLAVIFIVLIGTQLCHSCEINPKQPRCRIQNKRCSCDHYGCNSEYRYETFEECEKALRGKRNDNCNPNPCMHKGNCLQVSYQPGFKCICDGTGYFGSQCHRACPTKKSGFGGVIYPYECIVI